MQITESNIKSILSDLNEMTDTGFVRKYGSTKTRIDSQLNELSDDTLKSYVNKAQDGNRKRLLNIDSAKNRKSGINKAMDKLGENLTEEFKKGQTLYITKKNDKIANTPRCGQVHSIGDTHVVLRTVGGTKLYKAHKDCLSADSKDSYLVKNRPVKEEVLDELSDKTKDNYFTKAAINRGKADKEDDTKTATKRDKGINRLLNPVTKNKGDVVREDSLNELSASTLHSYIAKADKDASSMEPRLAFTYGKDRGLVKKYANRSKGVHKAVRDMKEDTLNEKNWITGAIKKPGSLHRELGVPAGKDIPIGKLDAASHAPGKEGKRARLALTLKKMHEDTLTEARRGRPPKDAAARAVYDNAHKDEQEHIVMQLRKAALVSGHPVHFMNGDKKILPVSHIHRALDVHDSARPMEKQSIAHFLHHSPKTFPQVIGEEFVEIKEGKTFKDNKYGADKQKSRELWKKISRKKKSESQANESVESLDELSKNTLGNYIKKATDKLDTGSFRQGIKDGANKPNDPKLDRKVNNRSRGIKLAATKLTKESVIDDLNSLDEAYDGVKFVSYYKDGPAYPAVKQHSKEAHYNAYKWHMDKIKEHGERKAYDHHGASEFSAKRHLKRSGKPEPMNEAVNSQKETILALNRKTARQVLKNTRKINLVWKAGKDNEDTNS